MKGQLKILLAAVLVILSSCSIVEITSAGREVQVERSFGLTQILVRPNLAPVVAKIRSLGLLESPLGATLGYSDQIIVALPGSCRVVFLVETEEQYKRIQSLLHRSVICPAILGTGGTQ